MVKFGLTRFLPLIESAMGSSSWRWRLLSHPSLWSTSDKVLQIRQKILRYEELISYSWVAYKIKLRNGRKTHTPALTPSIWTSETSFDEKRKTYTPSLTSSIWTSETALVLMKNGYTMQLQCVQYDIPKFIASVLNIYDLLGNLWIVGRFVIQYSCLFWQYDL